RSADALRRMWALSTNACTATPPTCIAMPEQPPASRAGLPACASGSDPQGRAPHGVRPTGRTGHYAMTALQWRCDDTKESNRMNFNANASRLLLLAGSVLLTSACSAASPAVTDAGTAAASAVAASAAPAASTAQQAPTHKALPLVKVHKDPDCGCCSGWAAHMQAAGFPVEIHDTG